MRELFRGWRWNVGVATLLLAIVFAGIWTRSRYVVETLVYKSDEGPRHFLTISPMGMTWGKRWGSGQFVVLPTIMNVSWETTTPENEVSLDLPGGWDIDCEWQCCGLQFGKYYLGNDFIRLAGVVIWTIPHWSITVPLTVVSFWLLLPKLLRSTQIKPSLPGSGKRT